ncbi:MAG: primosomal protein N' [Anaerolineales bacterium]|nr:primosomal protein N' [Anaerolineales bacterium]
MYADVVVNVPHHTASYCYEIPPELEGQVRAGHLVTVPFGGRRVQGVVIGLPATPPVARLNALESLLDPEPVLTPAQLSLAQWIADTYLAPVIDCLIMMLPPGLAKRADQLYTLNMNSLKLATPSQQSLVDLLQERGPLRGRQIDRAMPRGEDWRAAAEPLARRGVLSRHSVLDPPSVRAKQVRTARLAVSLKALEVARPRLSRAPAKAARLAAILDFLAGDFEPVDVSWVYAQTGANLQDLKDLAEIGLVDLGEAEVWRDSLAGKEFVPVEPPELTPDQQAVWAAVDAVIKAQGQTNDHGRQTMDDGDPSPEHASTRPHLHTPTPLLLHGVTGSGKTEIYLRALAATLAQGRRGLVLVPEIALTPQTVRRFAARFPGRVAVWHSGLGAGERYDTWRRARLGLVEVVIGARSALFAPLPNLGLIILDEEHDAAYKQDLDGPVAAYHARDTAVEYARLLGAVCLLGSATPDIVSFYRARQGQYCLLELPRRIMGHARRLREQAERFHVASRYHPLAGGGRDAQTIDLPPVEVVDLRQELRAGNTSIFSRRLQAALAEALGRGEQAILFLNRRGTATFVFCRDCGQALKCGNCDMPLTYHRTAANGAGDPAHLICHHCNFRREQPARCPNCGSRRIKYFGAGTERVEETVQALFPQARTLRWDRDATRFRGAHELILQQFSTHQADVLVGTQMIAKGLDLPLVTLVGVISADVGLGLPDYRAAERTFQVLTQVAGRAGRGLLGGRVILQSYNPDHYVIRAAASHDYADFYDRELRYRKSLGYPPFRRVLRLTFRHAQPERAEAEARIVANQLYARIKAERLAATDVAGPAPCFFGKVAGESRWHIVVRTADPAALARGLALKRWHIDVDPVSLL